MSVKETLKPLVADLYYTILGTRNLVLDGKHFKLDFNFKAPNLSVGLLVWCGQDMTGYHDSPA